MGEVDDMKKYFKFILSFCIIIGVFACIFGWDLLQTHINEENRKQDIQRQTDYTTKFLEALKNNGFNEAHIAMYNMIYLDNSKTGSLTISDDNLDLYKLDKNSNLQEILDIILPIWDSNFCNGDGKIITQGLINRRTISYDKKVQGKFNFYYKNCIFSEWSTLYNIDDPIKSLIITHQ